MTSERRRAQVREAVRRHRAGLSKPRAHPPEVIERALALVAGGISRRQAAVELGVSHRTVNRWVAARQAEEGDTVSTFHIAVSCTASVNDTVYLWDLRALEQSGDEVEVVGKLGEPFPVAEPPGRTPEEVAAQLDKAVRVLMDLVADNVAGRVAWSLNEGAPRILGAHALYTGR